MLAPFTENYMCTYVCVSIRCCISRNLFKITSVCTITKGRVREIGESGGVLEKKARKILEFLSNNADDSPGVKHVLYLLAFSFHRT